MTPFTTRRPIVAALLLLGLVVAGVVGLRRHASHALAGLKSIDVHMETVSTAAADAACPQAGHPRLICLAAMLKASVDPKLRDKLQLPYSVADAAKWSNFPAIGYPDRVGPTLGDFTPAQRGVIKAMLKAASGIAKDEGYDEIEQILNADDYLKAFTTDDAGFSSGNFHIAFLGSPAPTGTWELYFGGHHLAVASTYRDGRLAGATPAFRGVEPFRRFEMNGRVNEPMVQERDAFAAMLASLTPAELARAKLGEIYTDVVVGPQKDDNFPAKPEGIRVGALSPRRQGLVLAAIDRYVSDIDGADAARILARYRSELDRTYIGFSGTPSLDAENDYVRIDGPSVWIEFSMQPGRSLPGIHPHSVWRDRKRDYAGNH